MFYNWRMDDSDKKKLARASLNAASGAIPFLGGILAAIAAHWGEREQEQAHKLLEQWVQSLQDELREKGQTIAELMARLDMQDERIQERIQSESYQRLLKKSFRNWSSIDSEAKREKVRNILSNAAATDLVSDDVVSLFLDWLADYSDFHFEVIGQIYNREGITRGEIWEQLGKPSVREDSAEADLYKMLIFDLSTGHVIRQHRPTDSYGNFMQKKPVRRGQGGRSKSAFDREEPYELTELGRQFVHYAMNELAPRLTFDESEDTPMANAERATDV